MKKGPKPRVHQPSTPSPGIPTCPKHLDPVARKHWREVTETLHNAGLLSHADSDALACYCSLFARWRDAEDHIRTEGAVIDGEKGVRKNPWLVIAAEAVKDMRAYQNMIGLTPASRKKLGPVEEADPEEARWTTLIG